MTITQRYILHQIQFFHERTKYIDIDCHLVRQMFKVALVTSRYVATSNQPADLFTRPLSYAQLCYLLSKLGICSDLPNPGLLWILQVYEVC